MGAVLKKCCEIEEDYPKQTPPEINKPLQPTPKDKKQTSLQDVLKLEMVEQPPQDSPTKQEQQQFYDIDTIIEERQKSNLQPTKLSFKDFKVSGLLGEGSFGSVFLVQLKSQLEQGIQKKYAMKRISRKKLNNHKTLASIKLEKQILSRIKNPFITSLCYAFADRLYVYLIMEEASGGDFGEMVNSGRKQSEFQKLGEQALRFVCACIVEGLEELHETHVLYRDLKAENVLLFEDGYVKLSDFGLSKLISNEEQQNKTHAGTAIYSAPQMVLNQGYNKCVDFWALGVLTYQLATGDTPFKLEDVSTKIRFKRVAQEEEKNKIWRGHQISEPLKNFVGDLLKFKPQDRLGVKGWNQIKHHIFFANFDWEKIRSKQMISPLLPLLKMFPHQIKLFKQQTTPETHQSPSSDSLSDDRGIWQFDYKKQ